MSLLSEMTNSKTINYSDVSSNQDTKKLNLKMNLFKFIMKFVFAIGFIAGMIIVTIFLLNNVF